MRFFAYKEIPRDSKVVEFGWVAADTVMSGVPVVLSKTDNSDDGLATLEDYQVYFSRLTNSTPAKFLEKWKPSPKEYKLYWYGHMPNSEEGTHEFILSLAELILSKKPFKHTFLKGITSFQVLDEWNETKSVKGRNKSRAISQKT